MPNSKQLRRLIRENQKRFEKERLEEEAKAAEALRHMTISAVGQTAGTVLVASTGWHELVAPGVEIKPAKTGGTNMFRVVTKAMFQFGLLVASAAGVPAIAALVALKLGYIDVSQIADGLSAANEWSDQLMSGGALVGTLAAARAATPFVRDYCLGKIRQFVMTVVQQSISGPGNGSSGS